VRKLEGKVANTEKRTANGKSRRNLTDWTEGE